MHRTLMNAFSDCDREQAKLLYRLIDDNKDLLLYMQSEFPPDVEMLLSKGIKLYQNGSPRDIIAVKPLFVPGKNLAFNLLAYPSKKVDGGGKNSQRRFICGENDREGWLKRKATQNGFEIKSLLEKSKFTVHGQKNGAAINYTAVEYEGVLSITDQESFWKGYCYGIGAGKPYGLGLLMLKRV
jgi:CRISPR system Cascade subunit CasE